MRRDERFLSLVQIDKLYHELRGILLKHVHLEKLQGHFLLS